MIKVSIDPQIMKSALSGLIEQLKSKIDLNYVKKVCKEQHGIETIEGVEYKDGDVVVIKDQVAFRLDFEVRFPVSIFVTKAENSNSNLSQNSDESLEPEDIELLEGEGNDIELIESNEETYIDLPPSDIDNKKVE